MASMVGAPCWPLKYMISDAHDTRLPGTWPKISCVILCVRFSANEYGGLSDSTGDCSFHVNDRSKTRADLSAASNDSAEPPWALGRVPHLRAARGGEGRRPARRSQPAPTCE